MVLFRATYGDLQYVPPFPDCLPATWGSQWSRSARRVGSEASLRSLGTIIGWKWVATMHIGLIGGIGPAATEFYYRGLIDRHAKSGTRLELTIANA